MSFSWVYHVSRDDQQRPVDAIVVLGAAQYNGHPSPVFRARVEHALALYRGRVASRIVLTGGTHPGDSESEAQVGRRYLTEAGIPADSLVALAEGQSTEASMAAVGRWAPAAGAKTVLLVSDGFHLGRLRIEATRWPIEAYTSPAPHSPIAQGGRVEFGYLAREAAKIPAVWARTIISIK
jgi:uncharacterized SAM-binding protein YcdF (DUF218 family)